MGFLGGGVQPGSPGCILTKNYHFLHPFTDLASRIDTRFQTLPLTN